MWLVLRVEQAVRVKFILLAAIAHSRTIKLNEAMAFMISICKALIAVNWLSLLGAIIALK